MATSAFVPQRNLNKYNISRSATSTDGLRATPDRSVARLPHLSGYNFIPLFPHKQELRLNFIKISSFKAVHINVSHVEERFSEAIKRYETRVSASRPLAGALAGGAASLGDA